MNEWKEFLIEDLAEFCNAKRVPLSSMQRQQLQGSYPYYGASGIVDYVNDYIFEGSHVLISEDGENLKSRNTPIAFEASGKFWVNNHAHILKAKEPHLTKILIHYFAQLDLTPYLTGAVQPKLNKATLSKIPLYLPSSTAEQKAIASVLSSLDDKIDLLHRQNKTLEAMAETLFRQWFIEEAKEDWVNVQLKDIVKQIKPGTNYQPKRLDSGIPFLNVRNLQNGQINLQGISFISQEEYERVHKAWKPEEGDVLISRIGTLGIVAVLGKRDMPMAVHYNMLVLKPSLTNTAFLYFLLRSQYFQEAYSSKARQSVQEYVAVEDAESIELKLPLNDAAFANKQDEFYCLFDKIRANLYQIQTLENLRDTLLPKLMSGEVRVQYQTEEVA